MRTSQKIMTVLFALGAVLLFPALHFYQSEMKRFEEGVTGTFQARIISVSLQKTLLQKKFSKNCDLKAPKEMLEKTFFVAELDREVTITYLDSGNQKTHTMRSFGLAILDWKPKGSPIDYDDIGLYLDDIEPKEWHYRLAGWFCTAERRMFAGVHRLALASSKEVQK